MKILLIGNIGSGKTTIGKLLSDKLNIPFIAIDEIREKYSDGTIAGEYLSLHHFMKNCQDEQSKILETSGIGCHKHSVKKALEDSQNEIFVVMIYSDIELNKFRINNKKWPPHPWPLNIDALLKKTELELKDDFHHKFWENSNSKFKLLLIENNEDSIIEALVEKIISFVKNKGK